MQSLDDVKWYKNETHVSSEGNTTDASQRSGESLITSSIDNANSKITFKYYLDFTKSAIFHDYCI